MFPADCIGVVSNRGVANGGVDQRKTNGVTFGILLFVCTVLTDAWSKIL